MKKKKNKLITLLKFGVLLFGTSLFLWNCEKDNLIDNSHEFNEQNQSKKEITFEELINVDVYKHFDASHNLTSLTDKMIQRRKGNIGANSTVMINTKKINQVIKDGHETYSMLLEYTKKEENTYYNLVLNKRGNKYVMYTLRIHEPNHVGFSNKKGKPQKAMAEIEVEAMAGLPHEPDGWDPIDDNDGGGDIECWDVTVTIEYSCTGAGHWVGENCLCGTHPDFNCTRAYKVSQTTRVCELITIDNTNDTGPGSGDPNENGDDSNDELDVIRPEDTCPEGQVKNANGDCVNPPCEEIKAQITNFNFNDKKEELSKLTSKKEETGYVQNKTGTFTKLTPFKNGHSLSLTGINYKDINGFIHTHINDYLTGKIDEKTGLPEEDQIYRMFSPADVIAFLNIAKESTDLSKVYTTIITSTGNYTLRFTGNKNDITGLKLAKAYEKDYIKYLDDKGKEKGFLHFLKDHIKVNGIELYKLHKPLFSSTIKIQQKTLNSTTGKVEKTECE